MSNEMGKILYPILRQYYVCLHRLWKNQEKKPDNGKTGTAHMNQQCQSHSDCRF